MEASIILKKILFFLFLLFTLQLNAATCHGCDCSLDIDSNNSDLSTNGITIPALDGADANVSTCISGMTDDADGALKNDIYSFTVATDGEFNLTATSPNDHEYYLEIQINGSDVYPNTKGKTHFFSRSLRNGDLVRLRFSETGSDLDEYEATLVFTAGAGNGSLIGGDRPFTVRNPPETRNIAGNYAIIGNANQCAIDQEDDEAPWIGRCINSYSNSKASRYIDIDNDSSTVNSTTSELRILDFVPHGAKVVWAGLYWQGVIHNSVEDGDFMGTPGRDDGQTIQNEPIYDTKTQIDFEHASSTYGAEKVLFKVPGGSYTEVTADQFDFYKLGYSGFKDVTSMINSSDPNGVYGVANIKSNQGVEYRHGNYASWALVIIYEDSYESFKNITLFDGYVTVDTHYHGDLVMSGFLTPRTPPIKSKLALFAIDGDNGSNTFEIINEEGNVTEVENQEHPTHSLFDSTISDSIIRTPDATSLRTDLKVLELEDVLNPMSSTATLRPRTGGDRYTPSFFIMSVDLIQPELCYDYDLRIGDYYKLQVDENRSFKLDTIFAGKTLKTKLLIRNKEADFDFDNATLRVVFTPEGNLTYQAGQSEISPEGTFTYIPVSDINSTRGEIPIGKNPGSDGGTLDAAGGSTYAKLNYEIGPVQPPKRTFDLIVEGSVTYDPQTTIHYELTTDENAAHPIPRCPRNKVYNPIYGYFNVEVNGTDPNNTPELIRYSLPTQISGRPFAVQVVAYAKDANGSFNTPIDSNTTVEVEIIDVSAFDNNASAGYDVSCEEPSSQGQGAFIEFNETTTQPFEVGEGLDYDFSGDPNIALRNAAFRVWALTIDDDNDTTTPRIILNYRKSNYHGSSTPFGDLYRDRYQGIDNKITSSCDKVCTSKSDKECYKCLRTYAGVPYCSRDNFSIRPAFFSETIYDDGNITDILESNLTMIDENNRTSSLALIAGYTYPTALRAKSHDGIQNASHYNGYFKEGTERNATLIFSMPGKSCANDDNSSLDTFLFYDSVAIQKGKKYIKLLGAEVGTYRFHLIDSSWTRVDQSSFEHQTTFNGSKHDDCNLSFPISTPDIGIPGCYITSQAISTSKRLSSFDDFNLTFYPDHFEINATANTQPDFGKGWIYMNDLKTAHDNNKITTTMAIQIPGTILALGAQETNPLSNYTEGCFSQEGIFHLDYGSLPSEIFTVDSNESVEFQQYFYDNAHTLFLPGSDNNISLSKTFFPDDLNGTAPFDLYSNLKRSEDHMVNVTSIQYKKLIFLAPQAKAYGYKQAMHIPRGETDLDKNITFYYATVAPDRASSTNLHFYRVINSDTWSAPLKVRVYCEDDNVTNCSMLTELDSTDTEADPDQNGSWYFMTSHDSNDGVVNELNITRNSSYATLTPEVNSSTPLTFNAGKSENIKVKLNSSAGRLKEIRITIDADPWLHYVPDENFTVFFDKEKLRWRGKGKTGVVIQTEPNTNYSKRINW